MLRAYQRASGGKLKLHVIDPQPFSEEEDRAAEFGLQAVPLNQGGDKVYFGLAGTNAEGNTQIIPFFPLDQEEFLEYEVSRLVQSLATAELPVVGVLSGLQLTGGFDMRTQQATPPWMVLEEVRQLFHIESLQRDVDLIPTNVSVLLLIHPKDLPEQTLFAIDQFVLRGGKLLVFLDPHSEIDPAWASARASSARRVSDLEPLFKAWGVRMLPKKALADAAYGMSVGMGAERRPVRHAGWLSLPRAALDQDDVSIAALENITLGSAGILEPLEGATTRFTPLMRSSEYAMPVDAERFATLDNPETLLLGFEPTGERYTLAARIQGPAKTAFPMVSKGARRASRRARTSTSSRWLIPTCWLTACGCRCRTFRSARAPALGRQRRLRDQCAGQPLRHRRADQRALARALHPAVRGGRSAAASGREPLPREGGGAATAPGRYRAEAGRAAEPGPRTGIGLSGEQEQALRQFLQEKVRIRKELREVRYQLNADIEALGHTLKFANIALVPLVLTLGVLALWLWRRRRSA